MCKATEKQKSYKIHFKQSYMVYITPYHATGHLFPWGGHRHTHTHTDAWTKAISRNQARLV